MFRTKLLITACALVAFSGPAWAGSASTSSADAKSTSKATSTSSAQLNSSVAVSTTVSGGGNPNQPGGIAVPSPSAGYCGGLSGGFAVGFAGASFGASVGTIEQNCARDRHIGVGMSDPVTRPVAEQLWFSMNADMFGSAAKGPTGQQGASIPAAGPTPQQTASTAQPAACVGMNTHTNWYANNCPAQ